MPGRIYSSEEKYNIITESFQNPDITIAAICGEQGIAVSLFYKWKEQFLEGNGPDRFLIKENENIKAIIGEMTIANEILKII